jgi:hypothetical protein
MIHAESVNYWKTSRTSSDTWIEKTKRQIEKLGGQVLMEGFSRESVTNRAAFVLAFVIGEDRFKVVWPVLPSKSGNEKAAKVQAATMLYHDVKAKCVSSAVLGARGAFFSFLMLPSGQTAMEMSTPDLVQAIPEMFVSVPQLSA